MKRTEICAWHYATRQPVRLQWQDGKISALAPAQDPPPQNRWLAPPLVELQVNGFGGVDFQQDNLTRDDLLTVTRKLRAAGCTRFCLTLMTDDWPKMMSRLKQVRTLRAQSAELREAIAGWHIEGPFLSGEAGFHGAHDPAWLVDPKPAHLRELRQLTENDPVLLTLAPDRLDAIAAIALATSLGIKVSLGHTNATPRRLEQAVQAGAAAFTHLGNGCPALLERFDNILWRVLEMPELNVSLIPDRIHVSPSLFRLLHRLIAPERIFYVTDAMAAADAPPGRYKLGRLELEVGKNKQVRLPGTANLAGSALTPMEGVFRAARMLGCPWQETWRRFSETPARFMGWDNSLRVGSEAGFCILEFADDGALKNLRTICGGCD